MRSMPRFQVAAARKRGGLSKSVCEGRLGRDWGCLLGRLKGRAQIGSRVIHGLGILIFNKSAGRTERGSSYN